jgi:hypothetical protein
VYLRTAIPVCLVLLAALIAAPAGAELRFADLDRLFTSQSILPQERVGGTSPEDPRLPVLLEAFNVARLDCASPATLQALRALPDKPSGMRSAVQNHLKAPRLPGEHGWETPDGGFLVRYTAAATSPDAIATRDEDGDGLPDALSVLAGVAARARMVLVDDLGWPDPVGESPYEIVLARLEGPRAYVLPLEEGASRGGIRTRMVLDPDVLNDVNEAASVVAHQLAHASQWALTTTAEPWWYEATAAWAALEVSGNLEPVLPHIQLRARQREESLRSDHVEGALGAVQFVLYLAERGGRELVRDAWLDLAAGDAGLMDILDIRLRALDSRGLQEHVRLFHLWNLATGPRDTGRHYRNASLLPLPEVEPVLSRLPEGGVERTRAPRGLGVNYVGVRTEGLEAGVRLSFAGEAGIHWAVDAVGILPGGGLELVPMSDGESGRSVVTLPGSRYDQILLVVHNLDTDPASTGTYSYSADMEEDFPFRLAGLTAEPARGQVLLTWTTLTERDLWGWRVLRSRSPQGPWAAASPVILPAVGVAMGRGSQDYSYLDSQVIGGERYWYKVEGITIHGVPVAGSLVSAAPPQPITDPALLREAVSLPLR